MKKFSHSVIVLVSVLSVLCSEAYATEIVKDGIVEANINVGIRAAHHAIRRDSLYNPNNILGLRENLISPYLRTDIKSKLPWDGTLVLNFENRFTLTEEKHSYETFLYNLYYDQSFLLPFVVLVFSGGKRTMSLGKSFFFDNASPFARFYGYGNRLLEKNDRNPLLFQGEAFFENFSLSAYYLPPNIGETNTVFFNPNENNLFGIRTGMAFYDVNLSLLGQWEIKDKPFSFYFLSLSYSPPFFPKSGIYLDVSVENYVKEYSIRERVIFGQRLHYFSMNEGSHDSYSARVLCGVLLGLVENFELRIEYFYNARGFSPEVYKQFFDALRDDPFFKYQALSVYNEMRYISKNYLAMSLKNTRLFDYFAFTLSLLYNVTDSSFLLLSKLEIFPDDKTKLNITLMNNLSGTRTSEYGSSLHENIVQFDLSFVFM